MDLLGRPVDDTEVLQARKPLLRQPLVEEIFSLQQPGGYWGEDEGKPYTASGAVAVLSLLHMLGVPPDERTAAGCESLLHYCQHACGGSLADRQNPQRHLSLHHRRAPAHAGLLWF